MVQFTKEKEKSSCWSSIKEISHLTNSIITWAKRNKTKSCCFSLSDDENYWHINKSLRVISLWWLYRLKWGGLFIRYISRSNWHIAIHEKQWVRKIVGIFQAIDVLCNRNSSYTSFKTCHRKAYLKNSHGKWRFFTRCSY